MKKNKLLIIPFLVVVFLFILTDAELKAQSSQICNLHGTVFIEDNPKNAHFIVYVEETEGLADMLVYQEDNRLFADRKGIWFFTNNRGLSDFSVYFEREKNRADFTIFYTEVQTFAGCR
jgi:hypothetical protein